jgi:single-strand DNA-binding protein
MSINTVTISGNLTRDPSIKTAGTLSILEFSVAVNERVRDKGTGEWTNYPNYIDVTVFGKFADSLTQRLAKGVKVTVSGRLKQDRWEQTDGQKRSKLHVIADQVECLSGQQAQTPQPQAYTPHPQAYAQDIPF